MLFSTVPAATLDDIAATHAQRLGAHFLDVCLLKVDVEGGAALPALRGARQLLAGPVQVVSFEYVPSDPGHTVEELWILEEHGFTIFGTGPVLEERMYRPVEFEQLTATLTANKSLGTSLIGFKLPRREKK